MSRICRNMGYSGKLRFYELDHESKMPFLKTHSHTSNGLAMEPGTREEKQLKETQTLQLVCVSDLGQNVSVLDGLLNLK